MTRIDDLKKNYEVDESIASSYKFLYSYTRNAKSPIIFAHYAHEHTVSSQVTYNKNNNHCTLFIFLTGKFGFIFDNAVYNSSYGNAVLIRNNEKYTACFYAESYLDYYEIRFPLEFFEDNSKENSFSSLFYDRECGERNMVKLDRINCDIMMNKLKEIENLIHSKNEHSDILSYSYIMQIMGIINSQFNLNRNSLPVMKIPPKLKTAVDYIHQNFLTLLGVDEVATHCNVTATYLARMFKDFMFCTPNEYITNLRISHAKYLLTNGKSLTEACFDSGFNNYTYFITKFKAVTGITPSKFKKK